jgi:hypothetical protein
MLAALFKILLTTVVFGLTPFSQKTNNSRPCKPTQTNTQA